MLNRFQHSLPRTCNGPLRSFDFLWTTPQLSRKTG
ncbi:hypothetical protein BJ970_004516 [Saccharopolyspora phatthalungensis]|uniref:Uncharacterized protein n=1 Tax=Saccharopolyspora phatthalungensis TaxID=664693 RepID=A0A840Q389_9PSEU|nr:hypothetical protein [Saccharopolyspora phatthalungensis]